jgi:hypothetical protein
LTRQQLFLSLPQAFCSRQPQRNASSQPANAVSKRFTLAATCHMPCVTPSFLGPACPLSFAAKLSTTWPSSLGCIGHCPEVPLQLTHLLESGGRLNPASGGGRRCAPRLSGSPTGTLPLAAKAGPLHRPACERLHQAWGGPSTPFRLAGCRQRVVGHAFQLHHVLAEGVAAPAQAKASERLHHACIGGRAGGRGDTQTELAPRSGAALAGCCRRAHMCLAASSLAPPPAHRRCNCASPRCSCALWPRRPRRAQRTAAWTRCA